ncbi:MAG TPA: response regulator [Polyangiaceae bacterium]|nr:response regulator [Polyangiaceae bacterium]
MTDRILVVDDSPTIRKVVSAILDRGGYSTLVASDGLEALEVLAREEVDLVLLDFVMPRMNGFQFCREIRQKRRLGDLPIVLMSAKGDKIRGQFLQQTGAIDAITKPFDARGLIAVVEGSLRRIRQGRTLSSAPPPLIDLDTESGSDPVASSRGEPASAAVAKRLEASRQFAEALSKVLVPELAAVLELPKTSQPLVQKAIVHAVTPDVLQSLAARLGAIAGAKGTHQVLAGDLAVVSIAEVLQMLQLQRQSGSLVVTTRGGEVTMHLFEGSVDLARSRGLRDEFLLGRFLINRQALTRNALDQVVRDNVTRLPLGERLMELGLATESQIRRALEKQTAELVYEVVRWQQGRFAFDVGYIDPAARQVGLQLPIGALTMEGFRRVDEWRLIEGSFDFDEVLYRDDLTIDRTKEDLTPEEQQVLGAVDGISTIREIIHANAGSSFEVCKILYQFLNSRLVRRKVA